MFANCPQKNLPIKTLMVMSEHYKIFYDFFQTQTLCDITLISDDGIQISAHKTILVCASPMLLAMFNGGFKESKQNIIPIKEMESNILKSIVTCAYTFQLDIQENNIEKLVRASEYFQFNYAKDLCYNYIKENINVDNCINFMRSAEPTSQIGLYTYSLLYCSNNFKQITEAESQINKLYEFNFDDIVEIISNNHLVDELEEKVFDLIVGWIQYDTDERNKYLANLLDYSRLPSILKKTLLRVCNEPFMESQKDWMISFMKKIVSADFNQNIVKTTVMTPRLYKPNIIFAIKGQSNDNDSYVMYMDLRCEDDLNWKSCDYSFFCPPRTGATLAVSENGILLAIGGFDELENWNNCVDELDLASTSKMWIPTFPLQKLRIHFAVSTQGKYIYVVGGQDPLGRALNSVEFYDTYSKVWAEIEEPMPTPRTLCSAINLDSCLYVFGGNFGEDVLSSVDCYNLQEECWTQFNPMPTATALIGIASGGNDLYLFGGVTNKVSKCAYKINLNESNWNALPDMINRKMVANAVTIKNDLFVVGKNDAWWLTNENLRDGVFCERYIAKENIWQVVDASRILTDYDHIISLNDVLLKTFNIDV